MNKKIIIGIIVVVGAIILFAVFGHSTPPVSAPTGVEYTNTQYGFSFSLPDSWKGYTIVTSTWEGDAQGNSLSLRAVAQGPIISIRHPLWTAAVPRQDIPIMIFTIDEWTKLQADAFHIGAAPIGPSELGRNATYVFALPARYNYAFPVGYEEVDTLLKTNPLHPL